MSLFQIGIGRLIFPEQDNVGRGAKGEWVGRSFRYVTRGILGVLKNPPKAQKSYICHYLVSRIPSLSNSHIGRFDNFWITVIDSQENY